MADKTKEVGVRLSVKDADVAKRALAAFGDDGAAALKRIEAASSPAAGKLMLLSNGIQKSKEYSRDFAVEATKSFLGPIAAIGTAAGAIELLKQAIEDVKKVAELGDLADRIGIDVGKLQGLQDTFRESGHDVGELNTGLETFATNLAKASAQGGPLKQLFDLNKVKISGDTLTDLKTVANLVHNAGTEQQRLYITQLAFGRGSKEVTDLLEKGGEAIGHSADEAERLGTALDKADVQKARDVSEKLAEVNIKLDAAKDKFALLVAPAELAGLEAMADYFGDIRDALNDIGQGNPLKALGMLAQFVGMVGGSQGGESAVARGAAAQIKINGGTPDGADTIERRDHNASLAYTRAHTDLGGSYTLLPTPPDHAADELSKHIKEVTDALNLELTNLGLTNREQEINNELSKAHVTLASKDGEAIAGLAGKVYDEKQQIDALNSATAFLAQTGESAFEALIDGTSSWQDILGDTIKTLEKAVIQAELLGSGPLAGILGTASGTAGQTGGLFGQIISAFTHTSSLPTGGTGGYYPGLTGPSLAGARARGGPVDPGSAYLVGETGPELFMPHRSGSIVPNGALGGTTVVQPKIEIYNFGADPVKRQQVKNPDGGFTTRIIIGEVRAGFARGDFESSMALYGARRRPRG